MGFRVKLHSSNSRSRMSALCQKRTSVRIEWYGLYDIVSHHRAANTLQGKLADGLGRCDLLDGLPNSRANEDLTGLGFIAKSRGDVGYCTDRRVIPAPLKSNGSKRCKAMGDADPEAEVMTEVAPFSNQPADCRPHIDRHQDGLQRWVLDGNRIIEDDHHAVASKSLKRAALLNDDLADGRMIVAQERHHVFRV